MIGNILLLFFRHQNVQLYIWWECFDHSRREKVQDTTSHTAGWLHNFSSFFNIFVGLLRRYKQNINALSWNFDNNFAINFMWMIWVSFCVFPGFLNFSKDQISFHQFSLLPPKCDNLCHKIIKKEENQPKNSDNVDV